jgi:hypothetical protein
MRQKLILMPQKAFILTGFINLTKMHKYGVTCVYAFLSLFLFKIRAFNKNTIFVTFICIKGKLF